MSKVFLEVGTSNFDTLIPLIENGWQGYCVEPIAEYVHDLSKLKQNVVLSNCAISSYDGMLQMYQCKAGKERWERGISHAVEQQGGKMLESESFKHLVKDRIEVPCYTLQSYITRIGITSIDFLKVDVEGHENDIFDVYDWCVKPTLMKVEHAHIDDVKLRKTFEKQGYIVYTENNDLYAVGSNEPVVHALTFATDELKMNKLVNSGLKHSMHFTNIGEGLVWKGNGKNNTGCGQKINVMREYLNTLPENDIVLFVDGYDVFVSNTINAIVQQYHNYNAKVIFASEQYCWPDATLAELYPDDAYLNGGCWIGEVKEMKRILAPIELPTNPPILSHVNDDDDEQLYYTKKYLSNQYDIVLDKQNKIFQTMNEHATIKDNRLYNIETNTYPIIYHGNGNADAKDKFNELYDLLYPNKEKYDLNY